MWLLVSLNYGFSSYGWFEIQSDGYQVDIELGLIKLKVTVGSWRRYTPLRAMQVKKVCRRC